MFKKKGFRREDFSSRRNPLPSDSASRVFHTSSDLPDFSRGLPSRRVENRQWLPGAAPCLCIGISGLQRRVRHGFAPCSVCEKRFVNNNHEGHEDHEGFGFFFVFLRALRDPRGEQYRANGFFEKINDASSKKILILT